MNNAPTDLFEAILAGNLERTQALLASGLSPNRFDTQGRTPLTLAVELGRQVKGARDRFEAVVVALLAGGARYDLRSFDDNTPLMHAAHWGNTEACDALLAAGADPDLCNFKGRTALMIAAHSLQYEVMARLIKRGAQHSQEDGDGRTAIDILELKGRDTGKKSYKRCHSLLKEVGVQSGRTVSRRRQELRQVPFVKKLLNHFAEDERTQANNPPLKNRKFLIIAMLFSYFGFGSLRLLGGLQISGLGTLALGDLQIFGLGTLVLGSLLLFAFPSLLQLPYLLLTQKSRTRTEDASGSSSVEPTSEVRKGRADELHAISNFMRLGWSAQAEMMRAKASEIILPHTRSHLASICLAGGVFLGFLVLTIFVSHGFKISVLRCLIVLIALWLEGVLRINRLKVRQSSWDHLAADINATMAEAVSQQPNEPKDFVLYLRTFGVTGKLIMDGVDFEASIAYSLSPMLPVVALGHPGEAIGAGRILTTEEHWQEEILRLVEHASKIMLIPSHREGTKWEFARLKEMNYLEKTIIVMPPEVPFGDGSYSNEWNRAASELAPLGLKLPQHYAGGLLFKLGPDGGIVDHAPLHAQQFLVEIEPDTSAAYVGGADGQDGHHGDGGGGHGHNW